MATSDIAIQFKIITDNSTDKTKTKEEFNEFLEDQIEKLEFDYDNYVAFVVDNINDTKMANKAILLRLNGGDTQVFYNSVDTYLISKSKTEAVTKSDYGLMTNDLYLMLKSIDSNLNLEKTESIITENNKIINDVIEVDDDKTVSNSNVIYKFKDKKISTIDDIYEIINSQSDSISNIEDFLNSNSNMMSNYTNLDEYIESIVKTKVDSIINRYLNHTHNGQFPTSN